MTTNVAVPRTCPGQRLLPAVLGSLHSGRGEGQRVAEASPQPFARWPPTAHVAPPSHGCSGCHGGRVMLTRRSPAWALLLSLSHPSHLSTGLGRRDSPQNRVPASAGWAERSPVGWPHRSWELMPEPPVGPSSGGHAKPLLQPQGSPGRLRFPSLLRVTSGKQQTHQPTALLLLPGSAQTLPAVSSPPLCSARYYGGI